MQANILTSAGIRGTQTYFSISVPDENYSPIAAYGRLHPYWVHPLVRAVAKLCTRRQIFTEFEVRYRHTGQGELERICLQISKSADVGVGPELFGTEQGYTVNIITRTGSGRISINGDTPVAVDRDDLSE